MTNKTRSVLLDADSFAALEDLAYARTLSFIDHAWDRILRNATLRDRLRSAAKRPGAAATLRRLIDSIKANKLFNDPEADELRGQILGVLGSLHGIALAAQDEAREAPDVESVEPMPATPLLAV